MRSVGKTAGRVCRRSGLLFLLFVVFVFSGVEAAFAESRYIDVGLWYGKLSPTWVTLESEEPYCAVIMRENTGNIGKTAAVGRDGAKRISLPLYDGSGNAVHQVRLEPYRFYYIELEALKVRQGGADADGAASGDGQTDNGSGDGGGAGDGSDNGSAALLTEYEERMAYYRQSGLAPVLVYEEYPAIGVLFSDYDEAVQFAANSGFGGVVLGGANCFSVAAPDGTGIALLSAFNRDVMVYGGISDMGCSQAEKSYPYRGGFRYTLGSAGYFSLVNRVDVEEYLYGVVPVEMSAYWHIESLKAQAIAARNYAVVPSGKYARFGFDVDDSVGSQAYGGYSAEHSRSTEAVDATRGEYMLYDGEVMHMFFNASSGGYLDSVKNVWGGEDLTYLKSKPDPYSAGYTWTYELTPSFMEEVIAEMGQDIGEPSGLEILSRTESGRVKKMRIIGLNGSFETTGERFKAVVNSLKFKSSLFTFDEAYSSSIFKEKVDFERLKNEGTEYGGDVTDSSTSGEGRRVTYRKISDIVGGAVSENPPTFDPKRDGQSAGKDSGVARRQNDGGSGTQSTGKKPNRYELDLPESEIAYFLNDRILIYGHGYGHGIGLSQLGALKMAEFGKSYKEILEFYYNQVESIKK